MNPELDNLNIILSFMKDKSILQISNGEVKNFDTIHFKSRKPVVDGLHCQKIFGPVNDYVCDCTKLHGISFSNVTCVHCGVLCTTSQVRYERYGHIDTEVYYVNPLAVGLIAKVLYITKKDLNAIISGRAMYEVVESFEGPLISTTGKRYQIAVIKEEVDFKNDSNNPRSIGIHYLAAQLNDLQLDTVATVARLSGRDVRKYFKSGDYQITDLFNKYLLVNPPGYRPVLAVDFGFMAHDRNELYSMVVRKAYRIRTIKSEFDNPELFVAYESLLLQKSINALYLDGCKDSNNKDLSPIMETFKGKGGLLRGALLGKRVDFSGRTVISSGPALNLDEIGVPFAMLYELYKPHIIHEIIAMNSDDTVKLKFRTAQRSYDEKTEDALKAFETVINREYLILNRAPSLHRYSVQAFKPKVSTGKHIQFPPMMCAPYNADNDGDTVAVHVPLCNESKAESKNLLLPHNNLLQSATGEPMLAPSHEMIIGLFFMTYIQSEDIKVTENNIKRLIKMYDSGHLKIHDRVRFIDEEKVMRETCLGRLLLGQVFLETIDKALTKKSIRQLISNLFDKYDDKSIVLRKLKEVQEFGFKHATESGFSICFEDLEVPPSKEELFKGGEEFALACRKAVEDDEISKDASYERQVRNWSTIISKLEAEYLEHADPLNSVNIMYSTGSRVSLPQVRQLVICKGLVTNIRNKVLESPIKKSLTDGVDPAGYFQSCSGSRKSMGDKFFITPKSGYLTRQLVTAGRDIYISDYDCGTVKGIKLPVSKCVGRFTCDGTLITKDNVSEIANGDSEIKVRSPITCETSNGGVCVKCCGTDPSTRKLWKMKSSIGVIAAHSISEPSTQMSMRTFHTSGAATIKDSDRVTKSTTTGVVKIESADGVISLSVGDITYKLDAKLAILNVEDGQEVPVGHILYGYTDSDMANSDIAGTLSIFTKIIGASQPGESTNLYPAIMCLHNGTSAVIPVYNEFGRLGFKLVVYCESGNLTDADGHKFVDYGTVYGRMPMIGSGQKVSVGDKLCYGYLDAATFFNRSHNLELTGELFVKELDDLFKSDGMNIVSINFEMVFRTMTEIMSFKNEDGDTEVSLRRLGAKPNARIIAKGIHQVGTTYPSWLKGIGYGYVKSILIKAISEMTPTLGTNTERVMAGLRINEI